MDGMAGMNHPRNPYSFSNRLPCRNNRPPPAAHPERDIGACVARGAGHVVVHAERRRGLSPTLIGLAVGVAVAVAGWVLLR